MKRRRNWTVQRYIESAWKTHIFFLNCSDSSLVQSSLGRNETNQKLPQSFNYQSFACNVLQYSTKELLPELFPQIENCPALGNRFLRMELETVALCFGTVAKSFGIIRIQIEQIHSPFGGEVSKSKCVLWLFWLGRFCHSFGALHPLLNPLSYHLSPLSPSLLTSRLYKAFP